MSAPPPTPDALRGGALHHSEVRYTNEDDGIWLRCSCGWERNLNFWPSITTLMVAWQEHLFVTGVTPP